jgi:hypothetical protein
MIHRATYVTREAVLSSQDIAFATGIRPRVDNAIVAASESIDQLTHRRFHPTTDVRYFRWPSTEYRTAWRLWLDDNEMASAPTSVMNGDGTLIPSPALLPEPASGPPYTSLELSQAYSAAYGGGPTSQRDIAIEGDFGFTDQVMPAAELAGNISAGATDLEVTDSSATGVGDLITVGAERMIVRATGWVSSAQTLQTPVSASSQDGVLAVTDGTTFYPGELLLIDGELVAITDVAGNSLIVARAQHGSTLASHTGSLLYVSRKLYVARGANGTVAAGHLAGDTVSRAVVPALVRSLALAEAVVELAQQSAGYARTAGSGDSERAIGGGPGLADLRKQVYAAFGRKARMRSV